MTIITIYSRKGGTGKTTTAVSLAAALANLEPTILVDGDPQGQCTLHFGLPVRSGVFDWLMANMLMENCFIQGRPGGLRILSGDHLTAAAQRAYVNDPESLRARFWELPGAKTRGFVIVDTGGTGGLIQEAALSVSDQVVIPFRPELPQIDGLYASLAIVQQVAPTARVILLPVAFDKRLSIHRENLANVADDLPAHGELEDRYAILNRVAVAEAVEYGQTIWEYADPALGVVRAAYSLLAARVLRLAGMAGSELEIAGKVSHGQAH